MNRYGITTDDLEADRLVQQWRWLVPHGYRVLFGSALGDLFLADLLGRIHWLDVGAGELTQVAESIESFRTKWEQSENRDLWFGPSLVDAIEAAGLMRAANECFSYVMLPVVGGEFKPANFKVRTLQNHLDGWGPIQEKLADLPDGAKITFAIEL